MLPGALIWITGTFSTGLQYFLKHTGSLSSTTVAAVAEFHCSYLQGLAETGEKP